MKAFKELRKEIKANGWRRASGYKVEKGRVRIYMHGSKQMYVTYRTVLGIPYRVASICFYNGYFLEGKHDFETGYTWYSYNTKKQFEEASNGNTQVGD